MGTQAEHWTDIYATTHEQRLAQSLQFAREELAAKYGAAETRAKYLKDLVAMHDKALTDAQKALVDYEQARGRKSTDPQAAADAAARLLGVMAQAGGDIAAETGKAAQRKLEAGAAVESRYRPTAAQASAIGAVSDTISNKNIYAVTNPTDMSRIIRESINESIAAGVFAPGADSSKTAAADLFSTIDTQLQNSTVYQQNKAAIQAQMKSDIAAKVGVDPRYTVRDEVDTDRELDIVTEKEEVGKTGTGTSAEAARLAKKKLEEIGQLISDAGSEAIAKFEQSGKYFDLIANGATIDEAKAAIKEGMKTDEEKAAFEKSFEDTRRALSTSRDFDQAKLFDPTFVNVYSRSVRAGRALTGSQAAFGEAVQALSEVPTEEAARARGAEIYEPISPGLRARSREATTRLEERAQTSRVTGRPMSDEDLMASRLMERAPQLPDEQRILAGASAAAVRALDEGWNPEKYKAGRAADYGGVMSVEEFEALGVGPAAKMGYRLYSNIKDKQLRDVSPKGIVQYASDLAGGDAGLRDAVLQEYYKFAGYDMRGTRVQKAKEDVPKAEVPKPVVPEAGPGVGIGRVPQVDIKSEDLAF